MKQELIEKMRMFTVQRTLFNVMFEALEKLEVKYMNEGLTDEELKEYTQLIEEVGATTRGLLDNLTPFLEDIDKKLEIYIAQRDHLLQESLIRFDSIYQYMLQKGLVDEALEWIEKYEAEKYKDEAEQTETEEQESKEEGE